MLALVAGSEFLGMTLWFSATSAAPALVAEFNLSPGQSAWVTMAVQGGFVAGTLASALLNLPDLLSARRLLALGCLLGAAATFGVSRAETPGVVVALRATTGAALAWVYPTGMKLAAGWFDRQRGTAIAVIVASLTAGQAFPHLVATVAGGLPWRTQLLVPVLLAIVGALVALILVREGPLAVEVDRFDPRAATRLFTNRFTRLAALGYFGHMWELYAMWAWIGAFAAASLRASGTAWSGSGASLVSFIGIAAGSLGCLAAGIAGDRVGRARVAGLALTVSGTCIVGAALVFGAPAQVLLALVAIWGLAVVADSAQFSALVADYSGAYVGTALTIQTSIGYLLTMVSIGLVAEVSSSVGWRWAFLVLLPGPVIGTWAMRRLRRRQAEPQTR